MVANRGIFGPGFVEIGNVLGEAIQQKRGLDVIRIGLQCLQLVRAAAWLLVMDVGASAEQIDRGTGTVDDVESGLFLGKNVRIMKACYFVFEAQCDRIPKRLITPRRKTAMKGLAGGGPGPCRRRQRFKIRNHSRIVTIAFPAEEERVG